MNGILNRESLRKLTLGELDFQASQIYYFEPGSVDGEFYFVHCYRLAVGGWDCNAFDKFSIYELADVIDVDEFDNCKDALEAYINHFSNLFIAHLVDEQSFNDVYNGVEAIAQLRKYLEDNYESFEMSWQRAVRNSVSRQIGTMRAQLTKHPIAKQFVDFEYIFSHITRDDLWLVQDFCSAVIHLSDEIAKRDKKIADCLQQIEKIDALVSSDLANSIISEARKELGK